MKAAMTPAKPMPKKRNAMPTASRMDAARLDAETYIGSKAEAGQDIMVEYDLFLRMPPKNASKVAFNEKNMKKAVPRIAEYEAKD